MRTSEKKKIVLDLIFEEGISETEAIKSANVTEKIFSRWIKEKEWNEEYQRRCDRIRKDCSLTILRYLSIATAKLISLTESEKEVTARQACIDIIEFAKTEKETKEKDSEGKIPDALMERLSEKSINEKEPS